MFSYSGSKMPLAAFSLWIIPACCCLSFTRRHTFPSSLSYRCGIPKSATHLWQVQQSVVTSPRKNVVKKNALHPSRSTSKYMNVFRNSTGRWNNRLGIWLQRLPCSFGLRRCVQLSRLKASAITCVMRTPVSGQGVGHRISLAEKRLL